MKGRFFGLVFLLILLSFFSFRSLLRPGYFPMHDDMQAMRVLQMDKCINDGQIPCRWVPDMGYGYGYPQFIYYSPLPYYIMEGFHLLGFSILDSVKIGFILSFVFSGLAMFLLGSSLWGDWGGLVSAVFYIYAPYRASDVYTRGAVGEFWALIFLPLIFWSIFEFIKSEKIKYLVFFSFSLAGLLITHNITSLIFIPISGLWIIFLLWQQKKKNLLVKIFLGGILGFCLAGFFILPLIFEKRFAHTETMIMGYFNYLAHFVSLRQLFTITHWGFGSSELGSYDDLSFYIGIFHWLFSFIAMVIISLKYKSIKMSKVIIFLFLIFLTGAFMAHQRSVIVWDRLPFLSYLQFPWRFLTLVIFATSVISGSVISFVKGIKIKFFLLFIIIGGVIFLNVFYFRPKEWYDISDTQKFSGESWEKQLTISIFDYLPIFAKMPPATKAPDQPTIIKGDVRITSYNKGSDWQKGEINVASQEAEIRLPLFYFPGFKVYVDGREVLIDYNNYLGLITFTVPRGEHQIFAKLKRTPIRVIGDVATILGLIFVIVLLKYEKLVQKRK